MINPFRDVNWRPDAAALRTFAAGIALGVPLLALAFGAIAWLRSQPWPAWTLWTSGTAFALGAALWLLPRIARPFYLAWYALGCALGFIVGNTVATAVYFLIVTPVALLLRLAGRDPLERRIEPGRASYWRDAEKSDDAERCFRQY